VVSEWSFIASSIARGRHTVGRGIGPQRVDHPSCVTEQAPDLEHVLIADRKAGKHHAFERTPVRGPA
jgi:hypothetical protein